MPENTELLRTQARHLLGATEVAEIAAVHPAQVHVWWRRTAHMDNPFPDPIVQLKAGALWSELEVRTWLRETGRKYL